MLWWILAESIRLYKKKKERKKILANVDVSCTPILPEKFKKITQKTENCVHFYREKSFTFFFKETFREETKGKKYYTI